MEDAQESYYDTALPGEKNALMTVHKFVKPGHILDDSEFTYAPQSIHYCTHALNAYLIEKDGSPAEYQYDDKLT